ncbi:uncharacterized protein LOC128202459 [Galleria mellonella]|uniref:Uncharacterized protein LOC128201228 n=1 Tax=Galleria mellonella TaxID=7137 RepID=A0ABM3N2W4_GALME|nr:uncharacterized protein LOC128201228 [Galleria mellonella]XP_052757927.1 uncharacterized protein LOC128202269 [Galleria mellonella]XP_052758872.1 uncharacterized protein LOC128202459 [Galleria mellonella]
MESIQESLEQMKEHFSSKMAAFQEDLHKASTAPITLASLATDFSDFKSSILATLKILQQQVEVIAKQQDQLEMRSRRKILLVHGVQDSGKDTSSEVIKIITERLNLPITEDSISRSHRMGRKSGEKPRPILVKFRNLEIKDKVWFSKTGLKNSGITFSEFLTKGRHVAFMAARKHFGISKCWTRDGSVIVDGPDGKRQRLNSITELNRLTDSLPGTGTDEVKLPASVSAASKTMDRRDQAGLSRTKRVTKRI